MRSDEAMTEISDTPDSAALVPGVHRLVRTVDREEGPFAGTLVAYEDTVAVCVDIHELSGWGGWGYSDSDHVCGVLDVRRRRIGHDALLPWCTERVETFLGRRRAASAELTSGEIATLAASFLRGLRELGDSTADGIGDWWLTGDGRPLFVHGDGGAARSRTAGLVERLAAHTKDRSSLRVLDEVRNALLGRRHQHDDDLRWEDELFTIAAPRPLRTDVFAPERAADVQTRQELRPAVNLRRPLRRALREARTSPRAGHEVLTAMRGLTGRLRERTVSFVQRGVERSPRASRTNRSAGRRPTRKRALIIAGGLASLVLVVGLLWPEGQGSETAKASQTAPDAELSTPAKSHEVATAEELPVEQVPQSAGDHALEAVPTLLRNIAACADAGHETCPEALADGVPMPISGPIVHTPEAHEPELVDDYGDVAVIKLAPTDESADSAGQILVLERAEQKWLVRDIYDVAHQPD
jgi:hypothetical protein